MAEIRAWLAAAVGGDGDARDRLVQDVLPRVRSMVHGELQRDFRGNNPWIVPLFSTQDIVQDVLHDVLIDPAKSLGRCSFDTDDALLRYLATAVHNRLLAAIRHHRAGLRDGRRIAGDAADRLDDANEGQEPTPAAAAELAERARIVRDVMHSLPERHRLLAEMRVVDGLTFQAIADRLGYASAETARQAFWEVQAKLAVRLRAHGVRDWDATSD